MLAPRVATSSNSLAPCSALQRPWHGDLWVRWRCGPAERGKQAPSSAPYTTLKESLGLLGADVEIPVEECQEVQAEDARGSDWDLICRNGEDRGQAKTQRLQLMLRSGRGNCSEETSF